jgi:hypothetical protein
MSNVSGGDGDVAPPVDPGGGPASACPVWAPGVYPNCVYKGSDICPAWAPGKYPNCVVNACPPWAPGTYPRCMANASCIAPWGAVVPSGTGVTAWLAPVVPFGSTCDPQTRNCNNGTLSGSYQHQSCVVSPPANCTAPWGSFVGHATSVTAYQSSTVPNGQSCRSETRPCWNGNLSGSYQNRTCSVLPANCTTPWGTSVQHGGSVTAYASPTGPYGGSCTAQTRTCNDGTLSGSYTYQSCSVAQCHPNQGQACVGTSTWWDTRPEACSDPRHCSIFPAGFFNWQMLQCIPNGSGPGLQYINCRVSFNSRYNCQGICTPP